MDTQSTIELGCALKVVRKVANAGTLCDLYTRKHGSLSARTLLTALNVYYFSHHSIDGDSHETYHTTYFGQRILTQLHGAERFCTGAGAGDLHHASDSASGCAAPGLRK